jgi:carboxypeptidase Taq
MDNAKRRPRSASSEIKLAELKRRLLEINDLSAAGALLSWDHATYLPICGATARARQSAIVSRLAHERSVAPELGKLLEELDPYALPYESNEASLVRIARRDFEKAIKVPSDYVARVSAFGATAYDAWKRARPANDFATMVPFLERLSILVASTQTSSPPMSMSPTLSLMMPTKV